MRVTSEMRWSLSEVGPSSGRSLRSCHKRSCCPNHSLCSLENEICGFALLYAPWHCLPSRACTLSSLKPRQKSVTLSQNKTFPHLPLNSEPISGFYSLFFFFSFFFCARDWIQSPVKANQALCHWAVFPVQSLTMQLYQAFCYSNRQGYEQCLVLTEYCDTILNRAKFFHVTFLREGKWMARR